MGQVVNTQEISNEPSQTTRLQSCVTPEVDPEAWRRSPGPILLLAGPGTGKTHQLAMRTKDLIENHRISPDAITIITFTSEAAQNMRTRISDEECAEVYLPLDRRPARIATMHSLGNEIITKNHTSLGLPEGFRVVANPRLRKILFADAALLSGLSLADAELALAARQCGRTLDAETKEIVDKYQSLMRSQGAIDFDDQILLACKVLKEDESVLKEYADAAQHLLIDEFQDINPPQRELISLLSSNSPIGVFAVGDDDQSIYRFRGGTPEYIRAFRTEFGSDSRVLGLSHSRRCPEHILLASLDVVRQFDPDRIPKPSPTFPPDKTPGNRIILHDCATDDQEARIIGSIVRAAVPKQSVLILVPTRRFAERLKSSLRRNRIAYDAPPNIDDAGLLVLQTAHDWLTNSDDDLALRLCIDSLCESKAVDIPSAKASSADNKRKRHECLTDIAQLWNDVDPTNNMGLWQVLQAKAKTTEGILKDLHGKLRSLADLTDDDTAKFLSIVTSDMKPWNAISDLIREVRSWAGELRAHGPASGAQVRIMTLQSAKGLEAEIVCVVGMDEGVLPRANLGDQQLAETARLVYVSMTRAKHTLHLFHARKRDARTTFLKQSFKLQRSQFTAAIDISRSVSKYYPAPSAQKATSARKSVRRRSAS